MDGIEIRLLKSAKEAMFKAYAPYSRFRVGAALLTRDGRVFQGCNVENISFGLAICAERAAISAAISAGTRRFSALAVVALIPPAPCGACLQVMSEFCAGEFKIFSAAAGKLGKFESFALKDLLPKAFRFHLPRRRAL